MGQCEMGLHRESRHRARGPSGVGVASPSNSAVLPTYTVRSRIDARQRLASAAIGAPRIAASTTCANGTRRSLVRAAPERQRHAALASTGHGLVTNPQRARHAAPPSGPRRLRKPAGKRQGRQHRATADAVQQRQTADDAVLVGSTVTIPTAARAARPGCGSRTSAHTRRRQPGAGPPAAASSRRSILRLEPRRRTASPPPRAPPARRANAAANVVVARPGIGEQDVEDDGAGPAARGNPPARIDVTAIRPVAHQRRAAASSTRRR